MHDDVLINDLISKAKPYLPGLNEKRVIEAYEFAKKAHEGQKRYSGEPYIMHPAKVAATLIDFHADENAIIAALLHDVAEDTVKTLEDIERQFGAEVKNLCWGLMKLGKVRSKIDDPHVENLRKLIFAMAKDFRVVLIKLCDRLHNMQTMDFVRPEKRTRIAQETLDVYAPIAARLGIYRLKSQLEDLCFKHLKPEESNSITDQLAKTGKSRDKYIEISKKILLDTLSHEGINAQVDGRVKSVYSIYRKLKRKGKNSLDEIFDVFAMRVILPDIFKYGKEYTGHLYTALGLIHNSFTPLANRFKDYVAVPKVNGYRSLHTTVIGLGPKEHVRPTEIQFRTETMHQSSELGIAAHWLYEEDTNGVDGRFSYKSALATNVAPLLKSHKAWISDLRKMESESADNGELLENLQIDMFQDRIFILTPRGDVKDLPAGASPIDFAYSLHTEIGNHCMGAKVNGIMVPLDYELSSGEVVEIVTRKNISPNHQWISFVKTAHARNRIRAWYRNMDDDKHLKEGRILLNKKLEQIGKPLLDDNLSLLREYSGRHLSMEERSDLLKEIGKGFLMPGALIRKLFSNDELLNIRHELEIKKHEILENKKADLMKKELDKKAPNVLVGNQKNLPYYFVQCCNATFSDDLAGYITRGKGVSVHKKHCSTLKNMDANRFVSVNVMNNSKIHPIKIEVNADDRLGLIRDLSRVISDNNVNIIQVFNSIAKENSVDFLFIVEVENFDQLELVLSKLEKIPSVRRACKVN